MRITLRFTAMYDPLQYLSERSWGCKGAIRGFSRNLGTTKGTKGGPFLSDSENSLEETFFRLLVGGWKGA